MAKNTMGIAQNSKLECSGYTEPRILFDLDVQKFVLHVIFANVLRIGALLNDCLELRVFGLLTLPCPV